MSEDSFPYVDPPAKWKKSVAVKTKPGTRWWVEQGPMVNFRHWLREVQDACPGDLIPMQWAPEYVGVTRGGIKKRADAGKLTLFTFIIGVPQRTMLGKVTYRETRSHFDYAVISECDAWREEIMDRQDEDRRKVLLRENKKRI